MGAVTFYVSRVSTVYRIMWKKGKDKVVEWDQTSGLEAFQSFKNRVHLDIVSGNLTITGLTKLDEDVYEIESPSVKKELPVPPQSDWWVSINLFVQIANFQVF